MSEQTVVELNEKIVNLVRRLKEIETLRKSSMAAFKDQKADVEEEMYETLNELEEREKA